MRKYIINGFYLIFFLHSSPKFAIEQWKEVMNKNGISIFSRSEVNTPYNSFLARTKIDATLDEIIGVLQLGNQYFEWFAYTVKSILLKSSPQEQYLYMETSFPWPFSNEDMIYRISYLRLSDQSVRVNLSGVPDYLTEKNGIKRMKKAEGYIILKASGSSTEIEYFLHSEPSQNFPAVVANNAMKELPYRTLSALKKKFKI